MKLKYTLLAFCMLGSSAFAQHKPAKAPVAAGKSPADYVDLYIGSINPKTRSTSPVIKAPGGNMNIFPMFNPAIEDFYLSDKIMGFPLGFGTLMVKSGDFKANLRDYASHFDHDLETAKPYYYQVLLEDANINVEYTMTDNAAIFRFTIPANQAANLMLSLPGNGSVNINEKTIKGYGESFGRRNTPGVRRYFYSEVSKATTKNDKSDGQFKKEVDRRGGSGVNAYMSWVASPKPQTIEFRVGISNTSEDDAKATLEKEIGKSTFEQVKAKLKDRWNAELNLIKIKGGTERQRGIFYSTLYRTRALRMGNVWDTYRSAYALQDLIEPKESVKAINNFIDAYEKTGWLTSSGAMIGNHSTSVIVEAYLKGLRGFDVEKAYAGMRKNAMEATMIPWKDGPGTTELEKCYYEKGFYPALPIRSDTMSG